MKITDVRTTTVAVPTKQAYKSTWRRVYHGSLPMVAVLVFIDTGEGLTGIGEAPAVIGKEAVVTEEIVRSVRSVLIGQDPLNVEPLKRALYAHCGLPHLGVRGIVWALRGIDMALWDLVGKAANLPLCKLWGGPFRKRISFYADIPPDHPDQMAISARDWVQQGFKNALFQGRLRSRPGPGAAQSGSRSGRVWCGPGSGRRQPGVVSRDR